jgi:hypothetical protein
MKTQASGGLGIFRTNNFGVRSAGNSMSASPKHSGCGTTSLGSGKVGTEFAS